MEKSRTSRSTPATKTQPAENPKPSESFKQQTVTEDAPIFLHQQCNRLSQDFKHEERVVALEN